MRSHISCFWVQKDGNEPREYEDASTVGCDSSVDDWNWDWDSTQPLHLALADGASESFLAGRWAAELTDRYARTGEIENVIRRAVGGWPELLEAYRAERDERGRPIQWFEEQKMEAGAHATLVAASFLGGSGQEEQGRLHIAALGDACAFGVRDDDLIMSFPMEAAETFDTSPPLIQSKPTDVELLVSRVQHHNLIWQSGDSFYFATDALSHWFLVRHEAGDKPWAALRDLGTEASPDFRDWITRLRDAHLMRNDDVTLVRVDVH